MFSRDDRNSTSTIRVTQSPHRHRYISTFQTEITPASSHGGSAEGGSVPKDRDRVGHHLTIPELIQHIRNATNEAQDSALTELVLLTKDKNENRARDIISHGAIPLLLQILSDPNKYSLETRIRVAAAICNIAQIPTAQRSFSSSYAIPTLVDSVIGEHQALTGAASLMLKSMLTSEYLVKSMIEHEVPIFLLRAFMLCTNVEICDTVMDVLIQMTMVDQLKDFLLEHKAVEICIYTLHVLARCHYYSSARSSAGFQEEDASQPSFTYKSMREALIWYLTQHDGEIGNKTQDQEVEMASPEALFFPQRMNHDGWEQKLKTLSFLGHDESQVPLTTTDGVRASLFLELLSCLLNNSPTACSKIVVMQFSLDILRYWMQNGTPLMKQNALLGTCFLLRNGHRGFNTLRDIVNVIYNVLVDSRKHTGIRIVQYKGIAVEAVNDLCIFGGDNVRLALDAAGILPLMLKLLKYQDYQLQHLTLRAMHSICLHFYPLRTLVAVNGIPELCLILDNGLTDLQGQTTLMRKTKPMPKGPLACLSRKRVATISITEAEVHHSRKQEEHYSRFRRLDYCAALLRSISAAQSPEWFHTMNKYRIVPLALDALAQNHSTVMRKQALGILTSLVTMKEANAAINIGLDAGCDLLLNMRYHAQTSREQDSENWIAWINLILYHMAQHPKLLKLLEQAVRAQYAEQTDLSRSGFSNMFKPNQAHLNLEWLSSCV